MEQIRLKRGTDQKVHFSIFDDVLNRRPIDLTTFYDIIFEVFNPTDSEPILRKTMGTNGLMFREDNNAITAYIAANDTARFGANTSRPRLYRLTGVKANGERQTINEGMFSASQMRAGEMFYAAIEVEDCKYYAHIEVE